MQRLMGFGSDYGSHPGLPRWPYGEEPGKRPMRSGFNPWVEKICWRRAWQPTPVFLPGVIPLTEEPGRLQPIPLQRVRCD